MILDGHIHIFDDTEARQRQLLKTLQEAGVDGGLLISIPPSAFAEVTQPIPAASRLRNVLSWCKGSKTLYPCFWIDPLEEDAAEQVAMAVQQGVMAFKVICDRYPPGDDRAMRLFRTIAATGRPILFHSGILWDGKPSSPYNRPAEFEVLLAIPGLRFCLAHLGWPWCDELVAVHGKFQNAYTRNPALSVEMFVDITPGTPPIYRRDALRRFFTVGYDVENNVLFGTDGNAHHYSVEWTRQWITRDGRVFEELGLEKNVLDKIYAGNLKRFLGLSSETIEKKPLMPGT